MEIFILQMKKQNSAIKLTLKSHSKFIPYSSVFPVHQLIPQNRLNLCLWKKHRPHLTMITEMAGKIKKRK